jgi:hypothetical protein
MVALLRDIRDGDGRTRGRLGRHRPHPGRHLPRPRPNDSGHPLLRSPHAWLHTEPRQARPTDRPRGRGDLPGCRDAPKQHDPDRPGYPTVRRAIHPDHTRPTPRRYPTPPIHVGRLPSGRRADPVPPHGRRAEGSRSLRPNRTGLQRVQVQLRREGLGVRPHRPGQGHRPPTTIEPDHRRGRIPNRRGRDPTRLHGLLHTIPRRPDHHIPSTNPRKKRRLGRNTGAGEPTLRVPEPGEGLLRRSSPGDRRYRNHIRLDPKLRQHLPPHLDPSGHHATDRRDHRRQR